MYVCAMLVSTGLLPPEHAFLVLTHYYIGVTVIRSSRFHPDFPLEGSFPGHLPKCFYYLN